MQLTQQQAIAIARAASIATGVCTAKQADIEGAHASEVDKDRAHRTVQAVTNAAIAQGLVVEAAPIKPFVDLRSV